jgi:hypothetical protein
MKKLISSLLVTGLVLGLTASTGYGQTRAERQVTRADRNELDNRVEQINRMIKRDNMDLAVKRISTETGVPEDRVRAMHERHQRIGPAGLMIANVLANETKKEPEQFMREKTGGKTWVAIARDNNVPLDRLSMRLDRLETALTPTGTYTTPTTTTTNAARPRQESAPDRERDRDNNRFRGYGR